jgi:hypothetical protein
MYGRSAACIESTKEDDPLDRVRTCHELGQLPAMEGVALRRAELHVSSPRVWVRKDAWRGASCVAELDGGGVSGVMACPLLRP